MNLVVDDAIEVTQAKGDQPEKRRELGMSRRAPFDWTCANGGLGQILLKGDNVTLIESVQ